MPDHCCDDEDCPRRLEAVREARSARRVSPMSTPIVREPINLMSPIDYLRLRGEVIELARAHLAETDSTDSYLVADRLAEMILELLGDP
jgi:hypothetical protein